jgi:hypothetical protein
LAVDRGIRVFELELGRGGEDLIDMFLGVIVWCGVTTWYYPLNGREGREHEEDNHKRSRVTSIEYLIPLMTTCSLV